jgi:hypothetical protein
VLAVNAIWAGKVFILGGLRASEIVDLNVLALPTPYATLDKCAAERSSSIVEVNPLNN